MDTSIWRFLCGCAAGEETKHLFFAAEAAQLSDAGAANTLFAVYLGDRWYSYQTRPDWAANSMAAARYSANSPWVVLAMSQAGQLWEFHPSDRTESLSQVPGHTGMTNLATIDNAIYACGMGRVLLRREANGQWTDLSAPWPAMEAGVIGFTAVVGRTASEIYAVGWQGEIWTLASQGWSKDDSPTNANLNAIAIADNGDVYIVGDNGTLLKGQRGCWEWVDTGTDANLTDVCIHEGRIYLASDFDVFRLDPAGLLLEFDEDDEDRPDSCLKLVSAASQGLCSIGGYDVFLRVDEQWRRLA